VRLPGGGRPPLKKESPRSSRPCGRSSGR
jgi:hypothetical protein